MIYSKIFLLYDLAISDNEKMWELIWILNDGGYSLNGLSSEMNSIV